MTRLTHINPVALHTSPAFSQGVLAEAGPTLYIGGQNGTDRTGAIVGDAVEQSAQALRNVLAVLAEAGAGPQDVVKLTIYLQSDVDINAAYASVPEVWGLHPTAITVLKVAGFARPEALIEIDAIALIPQAQTQS